MDSLSSLNPEQRSAVEQIYGPVVVLAGPGTGKTHLLTTRIAHILEKTDAGPENILCLTFTNSAAVEMRDRLAKKIGVDAYSVAISTFHGFCENVMERYPETFFRKRQNREIADDLTKALAFRDAAVAQKFEHFSNPFDPFFAQNDFLGAVSKMKRENLSIQKFRDMIPAEKQRMEDDPENLYKRKTGNYNVGDFKPAAREKMEHKIAKMAEFADLWELYERELVRKGVFDFDDQINWVVEEIGRNESLRLDLAEKFQWILVDEYQDTNSSQNEILFQLTSVDDDPNVFVVGDDDQSIYRFQGASVENILEFRKRFPGRKEITLEKNYRSAQKILDIAFDSIARNLNRANADKKLIASGNNAKITGEIAKITLGSKFSEINFLIQKIKESLAEGIKPNEIAILVRKNSEIIPIARQLPKFGIPVAAQIFENIFDDDLVRILISMAQIFANPEKDHTIFEVLHAPFWGISGENLLKYSTEFYRESRDKKVTAIEFLLEKSGEDEELKKFCDFLVGSRKNYSHARPAVLLEKLLYESGLAKFISQTKDATSIWQKMRKFIEFAHEQNVENLSEILEKIELHQKLKIAIRPDELPTDRRAICISTAHKSKGREFDVVFIPGLEDKKWGNPRSRNFMPLPQLFDEIHDPNEDERRLFFVACTRARQKLFLSFSTTDSAGQEKNPSIFWHEVPDENANVLATDAIEESAQKILPVLLGSEEKIFLTDGEKSGLKELARKFVWSASSLQNYLDCPRRFLYQNLYRFPRRPLPQMAFGTAMHEAIEKFSRVFSRDKKLPSVELLLTEYTRALRGQNLQKTEFDKFNTHGLEILQKYFDARHDKFSTEILCEFNFGKFSPEIDGIRITGKSDKIEFLDNEKKTAKIIDYKSGSPKPIKIGERFWRQLVFYDLLARSSKTGFRVLSHEIEFLTPEKNGEFKTKTLEITEEGRETVREELKRAHEAILNLEFPIIENIGNDPDIDFWQGFGR